MRNLIRIFIDRQENEKIAIETESYKIADLAIDIGISTEMVNKFYPCGDLLLEYCNLFLEKDKNIENQIEEKEEKSKSKWDKDR